jgi:hypothetical protein
MEGRTQSPAFFFGGLREAGLPLPPGFAFLNVKVRQAGEPQGMTEA